MSSTFLLAQLALEFLSKFESQFVNQGQTMRQRLRVDIDLIV